MPERQIRVRGKQREDIDLDLLVQALLMIGEERCREREEEAAEARNSTSSGETQEAAA